MGKRHLILTMLLVFVSASAHAQLEWRVSIKIIVGPNGTIPNTGTNTPAEYAQLQIDDANEFYLPFSRGYQFRVTEIVNVTAHPEVFNLDPGDGTANAAISAGIQNDPSGYRYRNNAINVYLVNVAGVNSASAFNDVVVFGPGVTRHAIAHEFGHYLGLCHTQGCGCQQCSDCVSVVTDNIPDTPADRTCWDQNDIATNAFNKLYANCTTAEKARVDNSYFNLMSYHPSRLLLTPDQMDLMTDTSNTKRLSVVTGRTWFIDRDNTCTGRTGSSVCTNGTQGPFQTVTTGVNTASGGDIILVRPGSYNEAITISKAVTLRATRGNALVGKP